MSNPNAEAQRRWRQRQKEKKREALKQAETERPDLFSIPFSDWGSFDHSDAELCLALAGIQMPSIEDDRGPHDFVLNGAIDGMEDDPFPGASNSLGRAEVMVGCLISAAVEMASTINRYKQSQIKRRIKEIESSDLSDPKERKAALKEVVRLNKLLDRLGKQVRWTFPQWKVEGV